MIISATFLVYKYIFLPLVKKVVVDFSADFSGSFFNTAPYYDITNITDDLIDFFVADLYKIASYRNSCA